MMTIRNLAQVILVLAGTHVLQAGEKITLREAPKTGESSNVFLEFEASGNLLFPQGDKPDKAQPFSAKGRFLFEEKVLTADPESGATGAEATPTRALRYYTESTLESVIENRRLNRAVREPVRLMVAELRRGRPFLFSPTGPLTVEEYEMVEADASLDPLVLRQLLPADPVAVGDTWKVSDESIAAVLNFTKITKNEFQIRLDSAEGGIAILGVTGHVEGISGGSNTLRTFVGRFAFDLNRSKILEGELRHREERKAGPLGSALQCLATYRMRRDFTAPTPRLSEEVVAKLPVESNPATELLVYSQPDGRYLFHFERGWFVTFNTPQAAILRLVQNGELLSECHVLAAPTVAAGTHMKPDEFRAQVQQALGSKFQQFIQEGEVTASSGHWVYRVAAAGNSAGEPAIWVYHLAAGPQGNQLVFIFRVPAAQIDNFGAKDLALVGTIEFEPAKTASSQK